MIAPMETTRQDDGSGGLSWKMLADDDEYDTFFKQPEPSEEVGTVGRRQ